MTHDYVLLFPQPVHYVPAEDSSHEWCLCPNQVKMLLAEYTFLEFHHLFMLHCLCTGLPASHVILASCCWVWAVDSDTSPEREKSLELIRYLVPDVFNGVLVDSLSGHALSAAGLAASFLLEGNERAQLTAPPTSICSVIKAQKPGWLLMSDPRESCDWKTVYIKCLSWCDVKILRSQVNVMHSTINSLTTISKSNARGYFFSRFKLLWQQAYILLKYWSPATG